MTKKFTILKITTSIIIAILIIFVSCKKKPAEQGPGDENTPITTGSSSNINSFFTSNATPAQTFTINSAVSQTITGTGALIKIPANAFVTKTSGSPVTGTVQISVKEIYSKKDMILNRAQTMTSSNVLNSKGEFELKASQGSNELKLAPGKQLGLSVLEPVTPTGGMQIFYGSTNANQQLIWAAGTNTSVISPTYDSTALGSGYYYNFNCDSLNMVNLDAFYCQFCSPLTFTVTLSGNHDKNNTYVFIAYPSINALSQLYGNGLQTYNYNAKMASNTSIVIVAISEINGQYYSTFLNTNAANNQTFNLSLTATTNAAIITQLNSM